MPGLRFAIHHGFREDVIAGPAALDRITREGKRRPGESDQRHAPIQSLAGLPYRLSDILQFRPVDRLEVLDIGPLTDRIMDDRPLPFGEFQIQSIASSGKRMSAKIIAASTGKRWIG